MTGEQGTGRAGLKPTPTEAGALVEALESFEGIPHVAAHDYLVVEGTPDYTHAVDYVGNAGSAKPKPALDIVETANLLVRVAGQTERRPNRFAEAPHPIHAVGTDAKDDGVEVGKDIERVAESADLDGAAMGEGPRIEEEDDIAAPVLREREPFAGTQCDREVGACAPISSIVTRLLHTNSVCQRCPGDPGPSPGLKRVARQTAFGRGSSPCRGWIPAFAGMTEVMDSDGFSCG